MCLDQWRRCLYLTLRRTDMAFIVIIGLYCLVVNAIMHGFRTKDW